MTPELESLAEAAAPHWGGFSGKPVPVALRENAVFRARLSEGPEVALRLHRDGYQSDEAVAEELAIVEALADAGFACPWPWRTRTGDFVARLRDDRTRASVTQWIGAPSLAETPPDPERFSEIGALLADLHLTADAMAPQMAQRPAWDTAALTGTGGPWGDPSADPDLTDAERKLMAVSRAAARDRLATLPGPESGLIHGDPLAENILAGPDGLCLIDFDDCGPGFRLYDLASALIATAGTPDHAAAAKALTAGYLEADGPLPETAFADLPLFVMLRAQASAAWAQSRCERGDPRREGYRARALTLTAALF